MIWSRQLILVLLFSYLFLSPLTLSEFIKINLGTYTTSGFELHCDSNGLLFGLSCARALSLKRLHSPHPFKCWDITVNPSCAGTELEQHVASSISQFTAGGLCSQSGWIPLLDVHADTHQLCTCRRFDNCVFGRCSENSLLSASPDKVKARFFCLPTIPPAPVFSSRHQLKRAVKCCH